MAMAYHEPTEELSAEARNVHRALSSLCEELEAVNWYNQRADVLEDPQLKALIEHNRDEEIEHAAMLLEWLRRLLPKFDEELRTYLFSSGDITLLEEAGGEDGGEAQGSASSRASGSGSLGIGSLR